MNNIYDVAIIGAGVAGSFAVDTLLKSDKKLSIAIIDIGRPPAKRRRQLEGWLGCLPSSDGKFYLSNLNKVSEIIGESDTNKSYEKVLSLVKKTCNVKFIKDDGPSQNIIDKLEQNNYKIINNSYFQLIPQDIHSISKQISKDFYDLQDRVNLLFDYEVKEIFCQNKIYNIIMDRLEVKAKKILFSVGRSGWRFAHEVFKKLGLIENNDYAKYGIRIETPTDNLLEFNKSPCSIVKDNIEIGPFQWNGTVIPEDHVDIATTSFRSNEARWKTDKVSFDFMINSFIKDKGIEQKDRLAKLAFILSNDRVLKEKLVSLCTKKSKISVIPEYNELIPFINDFANTNISPGLILKSYFYSPTISTTSSKVNLDKNLQSNLDNFYIAGECSGISGLLAAAVMGTHAAISMLKE